jgi:hypothetical protein
MADAMALTPWENAECSEYPCEYVAAMKDRHPCETTGPDADVRDVSESVRAQMCATWQWRAASHGDSILAQMCSWPPGRRRPRATTTDAEARAQLCLALIGSVKQASEVLSGAHWCELGSLRTTGRGIILARTTPPDALL